MDLEGGQGRWRSGPVEVICRVRAGPVKVICQVICRVRAGPVEVICRAGGGHLPGRAGPRELICRAGGGHLPGRRSLTVTGPEAFCPPSKNLTGPQWPTEGSMSRAASPFSGDVSENIPCYSCGADKDTPCDEMTCPFRIANREAKQRLEN